MWIDGMGRHTVKAATLGAVKGQFVVSGGVCGVCRAPGWLVVRGPVTALSTCFVSDDSWRRHKARKHWMQRHGPKELRSHGWTAELRAALLVDEDWD